MSDSLLRPDGAASVPGATAAAETVTGKPTPGAGNVNGVPTTNDDAPANPGAVGSGMTGTVPTGGSKAVPDDVQFQHSDALGDTDSLDDSGAPGDGALAGNQGSHPAVPGSAETGDGPILTGAGADDGGVPTGGLSGTGATGGAATGEVGAGMGSEGR